MYFYINKYNNHIYFPFLSQCVGIENDDPKTIKSDIEDIGSVCHQNTFKMGR